MAVKVGREGTRRIEMRVSVWYDQDGQIHLSSPDDNKFMTSVNNRPGSERHHQSLYDHLKRILQEAGRSPEDAEGVAK